MMNKKKILLAFSGGLDTTFCAIYLSQEKNYEVHTAIVNTGGFSEEELSETKKRAYDLGVKSHQILDATSDYYQQCVKYMIYGNCLRNRNYPLSVSSERTFQSIALVNHAKAHQFSAIAHGSTAAGNDQVRFDLTIRVLAPEMEVVTPIRDLKLSREEEIDYLRKCGIEPETKSTVYSINKGLWGTSIGGKETLTSHQELPDSVFPGGTPDDGTEVVEIGFEKGEPVSLNGSKYDPVRIISELEDMGSQFAIGRDVHVGDTIIGIKGRVGFSAPAAKILIEAHLALEKHVLTRWQLHWKEQIGSWYGMFVHEAQFLEPVMRDLEAFLTSSQERVTGIVKLRLRPYHFSVMGVESDFDLMDLKVAAYGEENKDWSAADVDGFTSILANQQKIWTSKSKSG